MTAWWKEALCRGSISILGCALVWLWIATPAGAEEDPIATERSILDVIQSERAKQAEATGEKAEGGEGPSAPAGGEEEGQPQAKAGGTPATKRHWAILPEVGYSPEKGANGGVKFTNRDITSLHLTLDVAASAAVNGQQHLDTILISPSLGTDWLMLLAEGEYYTDPTKEFFGLGNNDVGPDELSTNRYQRIYGTLALALRVSRRFTLVASGAFNDVQISHGHLEDSTPSTPALFPDLAGIAGGRSSPLAFAVLFNDRQEMARPTRGWSIIAKASWVPNGLGNDFRFTRYTLDGSYLYPLLTRRQVIGLHLGGQYIDAKARQVPFYQLASLGGSRDLRGYFQDRFLGTSNVMINAEYRLKLFDFNFFNVWEVQIDGVAFGDTGRVFFDEEDIARELGEPVSSIPPTNNDFRWSYGGGTRIALGDALVARIDVGFSDEETGLVYLVFGHTF
ncbi:MAG TPA: BamA/TamA family outer membrane protein [Candidatus Binatia bacterium]|nr:BamA/TamA family outer membrane protein [Candidatus Binatia bacterium]